MIDMIKILKNKTVLQQMDQAKDSYNDPYYTVGFYDDAHYINAHMGKAIVAYEGKYLGLLEPTHGSEILPFEFVQLRQITDNFDLYKFTRENGTENIFDVFKREWVFAFDFNKINAITKKLVLCKSKNLKWGLYSFETDSWLLDLEYDFIYTLEFPVNRIIDNDRNYAFIGFDDRVKFTVIDGYSKELQSFVKKVYSVGGVYYRWLNEQLIENICN